MAEEICDVEGCDKPAFKSIARARAERVFSLKKGTRNVHLCRDHYKEFKKKTKKEREIDRLTWV